MDYETHSFVFSGHTLVYDSYGEGDRLVVYVHGLLLDGEMNRDLAVALAGQGFRVVLLELLGHGRSDKPKHASAHRMDSYADQIIGLLDELGYDHAVVGGVSLGANVSLFVGERHPERIKGLVIEMPVLENAVPFAAMTFVPLLLASHYGRAMTRPLTRLLNALPRTPVGSINSLLNSAAMDAGQRAAVLHGLIVGPICPTQEDRASMTVPTLVIGHPWDPLHAFQDADNLAALLPNATLVKAAHIGELRLFPARITHLIAQFAAERWDEGAAVRSTVGAQPRPTIDLEDDALDIRDREAAALDGPN